MELINSFSNLRLTFSPVFIEPSFVTFGALMTGWIVSMRHRYITDMIVSSDSVHIGHFSDYHRFFSRAAWDIDKLWKLLATLIVNSLVGKDAIIVLAGDNTLCCKRGLESLEPACIMMRSVHPNPKSFSIGATTGSICA